MNLCLFSLTPDLRGCVKSQRQEGKKTVNNSDRYIILSI